MPTVLTHSFMAQEVSQKLMDNEISRAIEVHPQAYFFGSQGPDFLFFYRYFSKGSDKIHQVGSLLHDHYINLFYEKGIEVLKSFNQTDRLIFLSYLAGHLCHWALDSLAHPYVFHFTGLIEGKTRYDHYRFEAAIDSKMVKEIYRMNYKDLQGYKFVQLSAYEKEVISKGYYLICSQLGLKITQAAIKRALSDMSQLIALCYDSTGIKHRVIFGLEKYVLKDQWCFSSHLLSQSVDDGTDVLNVSHMCWSHPCDQTLTYTYSFMDLFNQSIKRGCQALEYLLQDITQESKTLSEFIDNRNYSTGLNFQSEMNNFNLIYQKEN